MKVTTREAAWNEADRIFPTDYEKDERGSANAGYPVYRSRIENSWISDLGDRLEVNLANGETVNIWIETPIETVEILGYEAATMDNIHFTVRLANGKTFEILHDKDADFPWWIDGQCFSNHSGAFWYVRIHVAELMSGIRYVGHKKRDVPCICGVNGAACRCPGKCNTALCTECPVAEKFFAERDGVKLVYVQ